MYLGKSELRKWLNKDFYDSIFSKSEKSKVMEVLNTNKDSQYPQAKAYGYVKSRMSSVYQPDPCRDQENGN